MDTAAGAADALHVGVVHFADGVREGAGGVDDALRRHRPLFPGDFVSDGDAAHHGPSRLVLRLQEVRDHDVVRDSCPMSRGC